MPGAGSEAVMITVAIVDYGLGNLYSVRRACLHAGLDAVVTSSRAEVAAAQAIILPGVGAFGDAMATIGRLDLAGPLRDAAAGGKPLLGICLGVQLLMSYSEEFGAHEGLGIIKGGVKRFDGPREGERALKVPEVCWNGIRRPGSPAGADPWAGTPLEDQKDGEPMYFVHSYCVQPEDPRVILSVTRYGHIEFCSGVRLGDLFAFQFHPERSGREGLKVYHAWANLLRRRCHGAPAS
jgi:glutamine amidotransferase